MTLLQLSPGRDAGPLAAATAAPLGKAPEVSTVEVAVPEGEEKSTLNGEKLLVVSPYLEREHLLDLATVDEESALLAEALALMRNTREDYATAPYAKSFNWEEIMTKLAALTRGRDYTWKGKSFFVVAFRSRISPTTVYADLGALDKAAHEEATASGGFLKYWFGTPNEEGRNLATCIWTSPEAARAGSLGPKHLKAAGAARGMYDIWVIDRLKLTVRDDVESWEIVDWR